MDAYIPSARHYIDKKDRCRSKSPKVELAIFGAANTTI